MRNGKLEVVPSKDLVPGDIVILETGDYVPADLRIIEAANLKSQESSLTGESLSVEKTTETIDSKEVALGDQKNMVFSGSLVTYGRALVGTNVFLLDKFLELYLQAAWQPGLYIASGIHPVLVSFPINAGFRFWF